MEQVNIHAAKTHLSKLVERAAAGETIVLAKGGKPRARLVPMEDADAALPKRTFGWLRGQIDVPDDFDTMFQKEIEDMFYGESINPSA